MPTRRTDSRDGRYYTLPNGSLYPSVTTVLSVIGKPALINWAANMEREMVVDASASLYEELVTAKVPISKAGFILNLKDKIGQVRAHQRKLSEAGEIGSQVHALIEWNVRRQLGQVQGPEPVISPSAMLAFSVWEKWANRVKFEPLIVEQVVYSVTHQYAGTMDLMAKMQFEGHEVFVVVDWKTGKAIYSEALLQNVAYIKALLEMGHAKEPLWGLIVRLPKTEKEPEPEIRPIHIEEQDGLFRAFLHARALWGWQKQLEKESRNESAIRD